MFKLALHSVSYAGVWPGRVQLGLERFIPKAARLGYDAVMLMAKRPHLSLLEMTPAARREVKKLADGSGIRIAVLAGYNDFAVGGGNADIPLRKRCRYIASASWPGWQRTWAVHSSGSSLRLNGTESLSDDMGSHGFVSPRSSPACGGLRRHARCAEPPRPRGPPRKSRRSPDRDWRAKLQGLLRRLGTRPSRHRPGVGGETHRCAASLTPPWQITFAGRVIATLRL